VPGDEDEQDDADPEDFEGDAERSDDSSQEFENVLGGITATDRQVADQEKSAAAHGKASAATGAAAA
jgi:hypothetical protein